MPRQTADSSVRFLGLCGDCLIFVSHAHDSAVLEEKIRTESADRVFTIRSIGSAAHQHDDDDLRVVADRAVTAAKTAAVLPEFGARADYSELGSWILLQAVGGDRSLLSSFSLPLTSCGNAAMPYSGRQSRLTSIAAGTPKLRANNFISTAPRCITDSRTCRNRCVTRSTTV